MDRASMTPHSYPFSELGDALTPRELEVLETLITASEREAAHQLGISVNTVKVHLQSVYRKLGVDRLAEAYHKLGWL
jgi:LuxR family maltose regulon positive regulatory protein